MSLPEEVRLLLVARAGTDPDAARLLQMFTTADETPSQGLLASGALSVTCSQLDGLFQQAVALTAVIA